LRAIFDVEKLKLFSENKPFYRSILLLNRTPASKALYLHAKESKQEEVQKFKAHSGNPALRLKLTVAICGESHCPHCGYLINLFSMNHVIISLFASDNRPFAQVYMRHGGQSERRPQSWTDISEIAQEFNIEKRAIGWTVEALRWAEINWGPSPKP